MRCTGVLSILSEKKKKKGKKNSNLKICWMAVLVCLMKTSADEDQFKFAAETSLQYSYDEVNTESYLNKDNVKGLPTDNLKLSLKMSARRFYSKSGFGFACKYRGEFSYISDFIAAKYENKIEVGRSYFVADEFYIDYCSNSLYFLVGKERVIVGNGILFKPVDIINPEAYPDLPMTKEEGAIVAKFEYTPSSLFGSKLLICPNLFGLDNKYEYKSTMIAIKASTVIKTLEMSLFAAGRIEKNGEYKSPFYAASVSCMTPIYLNVYSDIGTQKGSQYTFFDADYNRYKKEIDYYPFGLIGLSYIYQGNVSLSFMVEYFYNKEGCTVTERERFFKNIDKTYNEYKKIKEQYQKLEGSETVDKNEKENQFDQLTDLMNMNLGQSMRMSTYYSPYFLNRHYMGIQWRIGEIFERLDIRSFTVIALSDKSLITNGFIDYKIRESFILSLAHSKIFSDDKFSQFGNLYKGHAIAFLTRLLF